MRVALQVLIPVLIIYFGNGEEGGTTQEMNHAMGLVYGIPGAMSAGWGGYTWWTHRAARKGHLGRVTAQVIG